MNSSYKSLFLLSIHFVFALSMVAQVKPFEKDGKYGFRDKNEKTVTQPVYDKIVDFEQNTFRIYHGKLIGLADKNGKVLVEPRKGGWMYRTVEGLLVLEVGGKAGILKNGEALLPFEYSETEVMNKNQIMAKQNGKWNLFNKKGKLAVKKSFEEFYKSFPQSIVKYQGKWAFLTEENKLDYPEGYQSVEPYDLMYTDLAFQVIKDGKTGIFTSKGEVIPCEYDSILLWGSEYNLLVTKLNGKYGLWTYTRRNKEYQFSKAADCLFPVNENPHLYDLIYGSDGCRHLPLIINKKVYYYDTNSSLVSKEFYDSYNVDLLMNERVLELTKGDVTIRVKGNRNCSSE